MRAVYWIGLIAAIWIGGSTILAALWILTCEITRRIKRWWWRRSIPNNVHRIHDESQR